MNARTQVISGQINVDDFPETSTKVVAVGLAARASGQIRSSFSMLSTVGFGSPFTRKPRQ